MGLHTLPTKLRHLDRRRRTLPPEWRDPRISLLALPLLLPLPVFSQSATNDRVPHSSQSHRDGWECITLPGGFLQSPLPLLLPLFVLHSHPSPQSNPPPPTPVEWSVNSFRKGPTSEPVLSVVEWRPQRATPKAFPLCRRAGVKPEGRNDRFAFHNVATESTQTLSSP